MFTFAPQPYANIMSVSNIRPRPLGSSAFLRSKLEIKSHDDDDFYSRSHSMATEFVSALWYAIISNTDLLCYLLVFVNMVASASLLAMPIPLMVFLWGTMTVSRPSKTFWVTLIAYTQVSK